MFPSSTRTTAALAALLAAGPAMAAGSFNDIPKGHWAFEEVHWLRADGMLEGWGGKFHGDKTFTRYEMSQVLGRYMKKYYTDRDKVQAELTQHRSQITHLSGRTAALERKMGMKPGAAPAMAPPRMAPSAPAVSAPPSSLEQALYGGGGGAPASAPSSDSGGMSMRDRIQQIRDRLEARKRGATAPPPPPIEPTPAPAASAAATMTDDEQARVDAIRARYQRLMEARKAASGGGGGSGSGGESDRALPPPSTSSAAAIPGYADQPLPGM